MNKTGEKKNSGSSNRMSERMRLQFSENLFLHFEIIAIHDLIVN